MPKDSVLADSTAFLAPTMSFAPASKTFTQNTPNDVLSQNPTQIGTISSKYTRTQVVS